jgi:hypothetical protein
MRRGLARSGAIHVPAWSVPREHRHALLHRKRVYWQRKLGHVNVTHQSGRSTLNVNGEVRAEFDQSGLGCAKEPLTWIAAARDGCFSAAEAVAVVPRWFAVNGPCR